VVGCEGHRVDCELVHAEHMLDAVQQGNAGEAHVEVPGSLPDEHGAFHDAGRGVQGHRVVPAPWPGGRSQENDVEGLQFTSCPNSFGYRS